MDIISLGGITPKRFLREYWQKKPLLIRQALDNFPGLLTSDNLIQLASQEEVQSRLVWKSNAHWQVKNGPLLLPDFCNKNKWTLLVHDVNHYYPAARDLLLKFRFIPYARLDDLMISYAVKGGGIGPHMDSYDVFLLQGRGVKRWQISAQRDRRLIDNMPLKILRKFVPDQEWLLESGDMLYLPPNYAHHGVAENDECVTYSIGFRAPSHQELMVQFLVYMQDRIKSDGWYQDPDLQMPVNPAIISSAMFRQMKAIVNNIQWRDSDVENFLGIFLTEPKPYVFFKRPVNPLSRKKFSQQIKRVGVQLDLKSRLLVRNSKLFINGEVYRVNTRISQVMRQFASEQKIVPDNRLQEEAMEIFYQWYQYGYIALINEVNC